MENKTIQEEWRRFEVIGSENQYEDCMRLLRRKKLTREDMMLLLKTFKLRDYTQLLSTDK